MTMSIRLLEYGSGTSRGVCAYCGEPVLEGTEALEHPLPAALSARWTTRAVCRPCNSWAGRHVDTPFLDDPVVRDLRFAHQIRDREGRVVVHASPLLTGKTAEGQRVTIGRDARPRALHPLVREHEGERHITARSEAELADIQRKLRERAQRDGKTYHEGPAEISQERPAIEGSDCVSPGAWERMAAKVVLGVASEALPEMWRQSSAAAALRERLRDLERHADAVRLMQTPDFVGMIAPVPCSLVWLRGAPSGEGQALVSLLGTFAFAFLLGRQTEPLDFAWLSDPAHPARSSDGPVGQVVSARVSELYAP